MSQPEPRNLLKELLSASLQLFLDHPAVFLTILYIQISSVGICYMWGLYREFGIQILNFVETKDFLMAAFKQPVAFIVPVISTILVFIISYLNIAIIKFTSMLIMSVNFDEASDKFKNFIDFFRSFNKIAIYFQQATHIVVIIGTVLATTFILPIYICPASVGNGERLR